MSEFLKTSKQSQAIDVLSGSSRHVMLYGGSRSGKTAILIYALIVRALKTKSRHVILRLNFNHAKTSIWLDTLPKILKLAFPDLPYVANKTDYYITLPNGSEIWVGGLDDAHRVEKILGREFSTIYFNECSQIPYSSISIAVTRLAEKNDLRKKAYYDENPPNKKHWSYWLFIKGINPETSEFIDKAQYDSLLMNPTDNMANIDDGYLEILNSLSEEDRKRFRDGEFRDDNNGSIYFAFSRERNCKPITRNTSQKVWVGLDFNRNPMCGVIANITDEEVLIFDEIRIMGSNTDEVAEELTRKFGRGVNVVPDSTAKRVTTNSSGKSDHEILRRAGHNVVPFLNPFRIDRYNNTNRLLEEQRVWIDPKCKHIIKDLEMVSYKEGTSLPDTKDSLLTHASDALGYLLWMYSPLVRPSAGVNVLKR